MSANFTGFENKNEQRRYPLVADSDIVDGLGDVLPDSLIVDAVLYPAAGPCGLSSIDSDGYTATVTIEAGDEELHGEFVSESSRADVFDSRGYRRGTLVLGSAASEFVQVPASRDYGYVPFHPACQFITGGHGVRSLTIGESAMSGDIVFSRPDDSASLLPFVEQRQDGDYDLRFDFVPKNDADKFGNIGIKKVYVVRQSGSLFNVISRDGMPYLYLSKDGSMMPDSLIDRRDVCRSSAYSSSLGSSYASSSGDACADTGGSVRTPVISQGCSDCLNYEWTVENDPEEDGFFGIPAENGFRGGTSMKMLFIEGAVYAKAAAVSNAIAVQLERTHSDSAEQLFKQDLSSGPAISDVANYTIYLTADGADEFFEFFESVRDGGIGYVNLVGIRDIAESRGWIEDDPFAVHESDDAADEFATEARHVISEHGADNTTRIYTIRARDYFDHFDCTNYEVASDQPSWSIGDEIRSLVGWGEGTGIFSGGAGYTTVTDGTNSIPVPRWMLARYVWWKCHSKGSNGIRKFIVPSGRGITLYTGNYYINDDPSTGIKETSPFGWRCPGAMSVFYNKWYLLTPGYFQIPSVSDGMIADLHRVYPEDYDPTHGDTGFSRNGVHVSFDALDYAATVDGYANRVPVGYTVCLPYGAPILVTESTDPAYMKCSFWLGPLEFRYDRLYIPGVGYTEEKTDEEEAAQALSGELKFEFSIADSGSASFNIDTTDIVSAGMSYENPIHIGIASGETSVASISVDDPEDTIAVQDEIEKMTNGVVKGNGIVIGIPGLGGVEQ